MIEKIFLKYNVDINRLKRNYLREPIKVIPRNNNGGIMKELPVKEDAYYLYIELNMTREDLSIVFDRSESNLIKVLREMGIKKDGKKIRENTKKKLLETEGIENVFQRNEIKNKIKQTNLEKYGYEHYSKTNEYKKKVQETCLIKYGVDNIAKDEDIKNKIIKTNLKKYGVKNPNQRGYDNLQKELLYHEDELLNYIKENKILNIKDLSEKLNIRYRTLWTIINKNNWYYLFDYSKSIMEQEIRDYINQYYETENNIKIIDGKEIDIYIPKLNIGVEFNGNYYHNEYSKDKFYHQNKSLKANDNNIFIYHIFEYEWNTKREQILNQLNNLLGINQEKIYARKCIIKEVSQKEKSQFLEQNHLQGNDSSSIKLGLYYNEELVSLMTFCKPRFNKKYERELSRFCSKANCNVIGGASKLFKYFINTYKPKSIISYSNISHTRGKIYETLGFRYQGYSEPNYIWWKKDDIKSRYQSQKHKLIQLGYNGNTEIDIMHNLGYARIYDCGNKIWIWEL